MALSEKTLQEMIAGATRIHGKDNTAAIDRAVRCAIIRTAIIDKYGNDHHSSISWLKLGELVGVLASATGNHERAMENVVTLAGMVIEKQISLSYTGLAPYVTAHIVGRYGIEFNDELGEFPTDLFVANIAMALAVVQEDKPDEEDPDPPTGFAQTKRGYYKRTGSLPKGAFKGIP